MSRALAAFHGEFGRACLYDLDRPMAMHAHREGHLVFLVSGVGARSSVAGQEIRCSLDTGVAVSPWQAHDFRLIESGMHVCTLVLYIDPVWFAQGRTEGRDEDLVFGSPSFPIDAVTAAAVRRTTELLTRNDPCGELDALLMSLTAACFAASRNERAPLSFQVRPQAQDNRIRTSIRLMAQRVNDEPDIDRIASDAGLSRPHFYRLFREHLGITPNVYLNTLRAERAIDRLLTTDQAVTSIGLDLGFASQASFTRFFRANVGIPPTDYRRVARFA